MKERIEYEIVYENGKKVFKRPKKLAYERKRGKKQGKIQEKQESHL